MPQNHLEKVQPFQHHHLQIILTDATLTLHTLSKSWKDPRLKDSTPLLKTQTEARGEALRAALSPQQLLLSKMGLFKGLESKHLSS